MALALATKQRLALVLAMAPKLALVTQALNMVQREVAEVDQRVTAQRKVDQRNRALVLAQALGLLALGLTRNMALAPNNMALALLMALTRTILPQALVLAMALSTGLAQSNTARPLVLTFIALVLNMDLAPNTDLVLNMDLAPPMALVPTIAQSNMSLALTILLRAMVLDMARTDLGHTSNMVLAQSNTARALFIVLVLTMDLAPNKTGLVLTMAQSIMVQSQSNMVNMVNMVTQSNVLTMAVAQCPMM